MDTTKQYILMCEKAKEIQELPMKKNGNFYVDFMGDICVYIEKDNDWNWQKNKEIWLPRQDQLQDILKDTHWTIYGYLEQITKFMSDYGSIDWSWEQIWLGFLMKEKYNKIWNGTDWVKEKVCLSVQ